MRARNYGIDLLRFISMFMICILHVTGHGILRSNAFEIKPNFLPVSFLYCASYCAVDCFALISGYTGVKSKHEWRKYGLLYVTVWFYSVLILAIFLCLGKISFISFLESLLPVSSEIYWYFTAYTFLFIVIPLLNIILLQAKKRELLFCIWIGMIVFSVLGLCPKLNIFSRNIFNAGGNGAWLVWLYIFGGFCARFGFSSLVPINRIRDLLKRYSILFFFSCVSIGVVMPYVTSYLFKAIIKTDAYITMFDYVNIITLMMSLSLLYIFSRSNVSNLQAKIISLFAPMSFSVYLIHDNPHVRNFIIKPLSRFNSYSEIEIFVLIISLSIIIYLSCSLIDFIRIKLFKFFYLLYRNLSGIYFRR